MPEKSSLRDKARKLTDFFGHASSASVPPLATSSSHAGTTTTTTSGTTRRRPATRASTTATDREVSTNSDALSHFRSASRTASRKRARSPDNNPNMPPYPPRKLRSPRKPKNIFQSHPHAKPPTAVIYVTSPFSHKSLAERQAAVHVRNGTLLASPSDSSKQVVWSSQSDEAELVLPILESRDVGKVVEGIHTWRQKAFELSRSSSSPVREDAEEVDTPLSSPIRGSPVASVRGFSPRLDPSDTNELPPLPTTPEPIDSEAKTAKIIAEIRARAFAANQSSDDEQPLAFRELEGSDDEDIIDDLPLINNATDHSSASKAMNDAFSSPLSSVPSTFNDATIGHRTRRPSDHGSPLPPPVRTSARTRKPAPAFRLPTTIAESTSARATNPTSSPLNRKPAPAFRLPTTMAESSSVRATNPTSLSLNRKPVPAFRLPATMTESSSVRATNPISFPLNRKRSQAMNPVRALLHEKELEDRRGISCSALRLAEQAVREGSREVSIGSDDEFAATNHSHFADEQAAWRAVHESRKSTSPVDSSTVEGPIIGLRESEMLGSTAGEAIHRILAGDKDRRGKGKEQNAWRNMTSGVPLWIQSSDEDMEVDTMSTLSLSGHPILTFLNGLLKGGDDQLLDLILRSGALAAVPTDVLLSNIPQLLNTAIFSSSQVADAVCIALRDLWGLDPPKVQMPFAAILFALVRLGASPTVLEGLGLITERVQKNHVTREALLKSLKRLLMIVKAAGLACAFSSDDVANVMLVLVLVGLDPMTLSELRTQLYITMDVVCNHGATDYPRNIHEKVLSFARHLTPINKSRLVSFFASGSGRTRCIARHLAYSLLVSAPITPNDQVPPLEPLILLLSPDPGSRELFDITNESTDYEELRHYIDILSVALVDIAPYVEEECAIMKSTNRIGSPKKPNKSLVPPLELLRDVLGALQSKIVDTRAAHLDRSRMKAAIQRLMMRICYDRMSFMGARRRRRASTLKAYFSPKRQ